MLTANVTKYYFFYVALGSGGSTSFTGVVSVNQGQLCELRGVAYSDGSGLIGNSIEGAAETTGNDATQAGVNELYESDQRLYFGDITSSGNTAYLSVKILNGEQTMNTCRRAQLGRTVKRYA